jgi:hypothetical protein
VHYKPGLPDFSWPNICTKKRGNIYQITAKLPLGHKIYQMTVKFSKLPTFSQIYPNWYFWFENKPSGNPTPSQRMLCSSEICRRPQKPLRRKFVWILGTTSECQTAECRTRECRMPEWRIFQCRTAECQTSQCRLRLNVEHFITLVPTALC